MLVLALRAWHMMDGLDWQALPIIAAKLGIEDADDFIDHLILIRQHVQQRHG